MISFERKHLLRHLAIAALAALLAAVCLEMILNYLHLSLLPIGNPYLKHGIHIGLCFLLTGGFILAWHMFPAVRNAWAAADYHLLDPKTRWKAVDWIYAILAMAMLLHHIYVTLYYPVVAAGAQKLTPIWIPLAAAGFLLGKLWKDKGALILSAFLIYLFERVYVFDAALPGNTVIILSSAIYSFFICYATARILRPDFRKPFLKVFCAISTDAIVIFSAAAIFTAVTETQVPNLVGGSTYFSFTRIGIIYGLNNSGGVTACGVLIALLGFYISDHWTTKRLYLLSCLPIIIANGLTETRTTMICIAFAIAATICLAVSRGRKMRQKKPVVRIAILALVFLISFAPLMLGQLYINKGFYILFNSDVLVIRVWAEESEAESIENTPSAEVNGTAAPSESIISPQAEPVSEPTPTPKPDYYDRDLSQITSVDELSSGRMTRWKSCLTALAKRPKYLLFGRSVANGGGDMPEDFHHAHNIYIQTLLENGIIGLGLFLSFIGYFLYHGLRLWKRKDLPGWKQYLPIPALAILIMEMVDCLTMFSGGHVPMTILYFFMGCTVAISKAEMIPRTELKEPAVSSTEVKVLPVQTLPYNKEQLFAFLQKAAVVFLSLWIAAYAFLFNRRHAMPIAAGSALVFFLVPCFLGFRYLSGKSLGIQKNRKTLWAGLGIVAVLWVALGLNNSSIGIWRELQGLSDGTLWGHARIVRGDEWAVWTPMLFSQASLGYPAVNTAISASAVDPVLISVGGLPAWTLAAIFKPFYWGFLLLGTTTGFSLMTLLRFAGLITVSYLCALHYTRHSKPLSAAAALLISLSPYVQWWYSQSICEVLLFTQGMILCWIQILKAKTALKRLAFGTLNAWCLGCFLMVAYLAWLIPTGYLALAVILWMVLRNRKTIQAAHLLQALAPLAVTAVLVFFIVRNSWDTLMQVKNSVYPGQRLYTGGDRPLQLFTGFLSLFFPVLGPTVSNASDLSGFLSFAPAGIILTIFQIIRTKKKDPLSLILLAFIAVFGILALIPLPAWLTKITLLSQCTRPGMIISLCDLLLLVHALAHAEKSPKRKASLGLALGCALFSVGLTYLMLRPAIYLVPVLLLVSFGIFWLLFSGSSRRLTAVALCLLAVIAGGFVNPVQKGFAVVEEIPEVSFLKSSNLDPDTTVIAIEEDWPNANAVLFTGYKFFNGTQPYADIEKWEKIDPDGKWEEVYNRTAHVSLGIAEETGFVLKEGDQIQAYLTIADLKALGVNTLMTKKVFPELSLIQENEEWKLYSIGE